MSSRLYQTIREKHGLAYAIYSYVALLSDTGVFGTYLGTDKRNIENALSVVHTELDRLKTKPVSRAELSRTKAQIKGTLMLGLENMSSRMIRLGSAELYHESHISLDTILKRIEGVTSEAMQRVANDVFDDSVFSTVIIRPS
jgi:predicted Zn-dependent peptidase